MKSKKISIILAFIMIIFLSFSIFFLVQEIDHECSGEDCFICEKVAVCEKTLKEFGTGITIVIVAVAAVYGGVYKFFCSDKNVLKMENLVSLKIEMLS